MAFEPRRGRDIHGTLLLYGFFYGSALWLVNFGLIAPAVFPQFTEVNQLWNGFGAHAVLYGMILGGYTASAKPRQLQFDGTTRDDAAAKPRAPSRKA